MSRRFFSNGRKGWFSGFRFTVIGHRNWSGEMVYRVKFDGDRGYEYFSQRFLIKEKCFQFDEKTGKYIGPSIVGLQR